jgi:hypothetical protein
MIWGRCIAVHRNRSGDGLHLRPALQEMYVARREESESL